MTLEELLRSDPASLSAPDWADKATTDEQIEAWLNERVTRPASEVRVSAADIANIVSMAEFEAWATSANAATRRAYSIFSDCLSGGVSLSGEQVRAMLALLDGELEPATETAVAALTEQSQARWVALGLPYEPKIGHIQVMRS